MADIEDEADIPAILLPCATCSRTFKPQSLEKHTKVCAKAAAKKRKTFDSSKQRIQGTELAEFLPTLAIINKNREKQQQHVKKVQSKWKERHLELVRAVRAARGIEVSPRPAGSAGKLCDHEKCPHCDRQFGPKAYDRHIEWCKEQKARMPKSPGSSKAKERLEARLKYRAPPVMKSRQMLIRDKYSSAANLVKPGPPATPASPSEQQPQQQKTAVTTEKKSPNRPHEVVRQATKPTLQRNASISGPRSSMRQRSVSPVKRVSSQPAKTASSPKSEAIPQIRKGGNKDTKLKDLVSPNSNSARQKANTPVTTPHHPHPPPPKSKSDDVQEKRNAASLKPPPPSPITRKLSNTTVNGEGDANVTTPTLSISDRLRGSISVTNCISRKGDHPAELSSSASVAKLEQPDCSFVSLIPTKFNLSRKVIQLNEVTVNVPEMRVSGISLSGKEAAPPQLVTWKQIANLPDPLPSNSQTVADSEDPESDCDDSSNPVNRTYAVDSLSVDSIEAQNICSGEGSTIESARGYSYDGGIGTEGSQTALSSDSLFDGKDTFESSSILGTDVNADSLEANVCVGGDETDGNDDHQPFTWPVTVSCGGATKSYATFEVDAGLFKSEEISDSSTPVKDGEFALEAAQKVEFKIARGGEVRTDSNVCGDSSTENAVFDTGSSADLQVTDDCNDDRSISGKGIVEDGSGDYDSIIGECLDRMEHCRSNEVSYSSYDKNADKSGRGVRREEEVANHHRTSDESQYGSTTEKYPDGIEYSQSKEVTYSSDEKNADKSSREVNGEEEVANHHGISDDSQYGSTVRKCRDRTENCQSIEVTFPSDSTNAGKNSRGVKGEEKGANHHRTSDENQYGPATGKSPDGIDYCRSNDVTYFSGNKTVNKNREEEGMNHYHSSEPEPQHEEESYVNFTKRMEVPGRKTQNGAQFSPAQPPDVEDALKSGCSSGTSQKMKRPKEKCKQESIFRCKKPKLKCKKARSGPCEKSCDIYRHLVEDLKLNEIAKDAWNLGLSYQYNSKVVREECGCETDLESSPEKHRDLEESLEYGSRAEEGCGFENCDGTACELYINEKCGLYGGVTDDSYADGGDLHVESDELSEFAYNEGCCVSENEEGPSCSVSKEGDSSSTKFGDDPGTGYKYIYVENEGCDAAEGIVTDCVEVASNRAKCPVGSKLLVTSDLDNVVINNCLGKGSDRVASAFRGTEPNDPQNSTDGGTGMSEPSSDHEVGESSRKFHEGEEERDKCTDNYMQKQPGEMYLDLENDSIAEKGEICKDDSNFTSPAGICGNLDDNDAHHFTVRNEFARNGSVGSRPKCADVAGGDDEKVRVTTTDEVTTVQPVTRRGDVSENVAKGGEVTPHSAAKERRCATYKKELTNSEKTEGKANIQPVTSGTDIKSGVSGNVAAGTSETGPDSVAAGDRKPSSSKNASAKGKRSKTKTNIQPVTSETDVKSDVSENVAAGIGETGPDPGAAGEPKPASSKNTSAKGKKSRSKANIQPVLSGTGIESGVSENVAAGMGETGPESAAAEECKPASSKNGTTKGKMSKGKANSSVIKLKVKKKPPCSAKAEKPATKKLLRVPGNNNNKEVNNCGDGQNSVLNPERSHWTPNSPLASPADFHKVISAGEAETPVSHSLRGLDSHHGDGFNSVNQINNFIGGRELKLPSIVSKPEKEMSANNLFPHHGSSSNVANDKATKLTVGQLAATTYEDSKLSNKPFLPDIGVLAAPPLLGAPAGQCSNEMCFEVGVHQEGTHLLCVQSKIPRPFLSRKAVSKSKAQVMKVHHLPSMDTSLVNFSSLSRRSPHQTMVDREGNDMEQRYPTICSSGSESSLPPIGVGQRERTEDVAESAQQQSASLSKLSKFCHECGSKYPVNLAKFCCECGVRRLLV